MMPLTLRRHAAFAAIDYWLTLILLLAFRFIIDYAFR